MQYLNLRTHEVRHYLRTGEVCVVRAFTPPPPFDVDDDISVQLAVGSIKSPMAPGSVVSCREKWRLVVGKWAVWIEYADGVRVITPSRMWASSDPDKQPWDTVRFNTWRSASTMPAWAIRPELRDVRVKGAEVIHIQDISVGGYMFPSEVALCGCPEDLCEDADAEIEWFIADFDAHNKPGRKWKDNPYCSVVTLRREG